MHKEDLPLNNTQWLICHKTQPNGIIYNISNIYIYIFKEDVALNNPKSLICHTSEPTLTKTMLANEQFSIFRFKKISANEQICVSTLKNVGK